MVNWQRHLKNLFQLRKQGVLGIDIGTGTLKMLEGVRCDSGLVIKTAVSRPLPVASADKAEIYAQLINQTMQIEGIQAKYAVLALAKRNFFSRVIEFPGLTEAEVAEAIAWELEKYVPYPADSYYYDFAVLPTSESAKISKIILVAAPQQMIDYWVGVFKATPLKLLAIEGEMFALERLIIQAKNYLILDIGEKSGQIMLYQDSIPVAVRNISLGGDRFTAVIAEILQLDIEAAEALKQRLAKPVEMRLHAVWQPLVAELAGELRQTLEYYQLQNRKAKVQQVFLCGGGANLPELTEDLAKLIDLPVMLVNSMAGLSNRQSLAVNYLRDMMPQMAIAAGLLLRGDLRC